MPRPKLRRYFRHGLFPQLMVFEAVARLESVTRAAEELHMAQPTVSTQMKKLSDNLGVALLEQRGRRLFPTPAGRELLASCEELAELFVRTEERLERLRAPRMDLVRIGAAPGARHLAARLLAAFCQSHPEVRVRLHVGCRAELLGRLAAGEDECCFLSAPDDRIGLVLHPVATELLRVYAPARHALAKARAIEPRTLAGEPLVLREPGASLRDILLAVCGAGGGRPIVRAELASDEAIAEAIGSGLGLGLLPEREALPHKGAIVALDVQGFPLRREWNLAHARGGRLSPLAALFLAEALHGEIRDSQAEHQPDSTGIGDQGLLLVTQ
ncbi:MAG TPA: LysR substrate-binding domain-containing protein [Burkholderiales bacterium]|nr:LysR substrate-binding domain-containing protein [Burkholderiales bacterium]